MVGPRHAGKSALRAQARARRAAAAPTSALSLRDVLTSLPEISAAGCVAAYVARPSEPDPAELVATLEARGVQVLLPVLRPDLDLDWAPDAGPRVASTVRAGLLEPSGPRLGPAGLARAQVILVPALAADRSGTRLGYGGGSYDRALVRRAPGALLVVLLHDGELSEEPLPSEPHDVRVDAVATPSGVTRL